MARPINPSSSKTASPDFQKSATLLHRITALAIAFIAFPVFTLWLFSVASSPENYAFFLHYMVHAADKNSFAFSVNILSRIIGVGLTWCFFYHVMASIRFNALKGSRNPSLRESHGFYSAMSMIALLITFLVWALILLR
ncbi:succinate dehydrogenase, cytochrome b556 subunit [Zymomonas mobilis]|uniref:Succinate dehydrogenase cytochrome b556 subunit n=1 Tax=Zymomonas mobilis subsp. pomaceae (strain ATCC 29192 / DSM 22645 / JCM 10191 / CCUG 17912 / NBRC 13757 / NCIMB 11200 / NRRL B-4491 / Barker I) TaxID=579138 RepID=F8ERX5_ZYMMT|nr:succinate dehydrogenase cytochrome b subunit [Zymomonas mobilis]AEI37550.1 hypothetical protein Zymop_0648 [Zymomonas mobilis subsp. pomaceae ATCC 29192]MDX5948918.1 succinate dehydrogenase [Zymomonas mobilis subsp. pomaceae]GEB88724.1 hypothetical protein ZMO02_03610 [Zymomonas mobilis subsp. pomaceae]